MTSQQLRAFRRLVQTRRDMESSGWHGPMVLVWSKARTEVDRAFEADRCNHDDEHDTWFVLNQRITAATNRLAGVS